MNQYSMRDKPAGGIRYAKEEDSDVRSALAVLLVTSMQACAQEAIETCCK